MPCEPNFWIIAGQLATPIVVAAVGAYFAWQQIQTARKKLRLDHYDKRFEVFKAAKGMLGVAITHGPNTSTESLQTFVSGTLGASFLFDDPDLHAFLDKIRDAVVDLPGLDANLRRADTGPDREIAQEKFLKAMAWLRAAYDELEVKFKPHLILKD